MAQCYILEHRIVQIDVEVHATYYSKCDVRYTMHCHQDLILLTCLDQEINNNFFVEMFDQLMTQYVTNMTSEQSFLGND
jgi:hypothetical protein